MRVRTLSTSKRIAVLTAGAVALLGLPVLSSSAAVADASTLPPLCNPSFTTNGDTTWVLVEDCSITQPITLDPTNTAGGNSGQIVDGAGFTIFAADDPASGPFSGPVFDGINGTDPLLPVTIKNLTINDTLATSVAPAAIRLTNSNGLIQKVTINGKPAGNPTSSGDGIDILNNVPPTPHAVTVKVFNTRISNYQGKGLLVEGAVNLVAGVLNVGPGTGSDTGATAPSTSVAILNGAAASISKSTIATNEYNGPDATAAGTGILADTAGAVSVFKSVIQGTNGDIGVQVDNHATPAVATHVTLMCTLLSRTTVADGLNRFDVGVNLIRRTGVPKDTVTLNSVSYAGWLTKAQTQGASTPVAMPVTSNPNGKCNADPPARLRVPGGFTSSQVTWRPVGFHTYAPLAGYTVTARASGDPSSHRMRVLPGVTSATLAGLIRGRDYRVSVTARNASGYATSTRMLMGPRLTLNRPATISYGGRTRITGTMSVSSRRASVAGRLISVFSRLATGGAYKLLGHTTTNTSGRFAYPVNPGRSTVYRATYAGAPYLGAVSNQRALGVAPVVTRQVSRERVPLGARVGFTGTVVPNHKGSTVFLQRLSGRHWLNV
ncbi:MAG: fibronectin type III domain-containing protein, partial [Nocardioidaceae bacterium]